MTVSVRLDDVLEDTLNRLSTVLHKKKSDVIREAISYYAKSVDQDKKSRILRAVEKTKHIDEKEYQYFEGTLDDGIQG